MGRNDPGLNYLAGGIFYFDTDVIVLKKLAIAKYLFDPVLDTWRVKCSRRFYCHVIVCPPVPLIVLLFHSRSIVIRRTLCLF